MDHYSVAESASEALNHIRVTRINLKLSQAEVASRAGLSRRIISKIESGQDRNPSIKTFFKLAKAVGLQPAITFLALPQP